MAARRRGRSHPSLLLENELARAVRTEAVEAVRYWWGVSHGVVHRWRRFLDLTRTNNPGTNRLQRANAQAGAEAVKAKDWTEAELQAKREIAQRLVLARDLKPGYYGPRWTAAQSKLLGKLPDAEVATRIGRTGGAMRQTRNLAGRLQRRTADHEKKVRGSQQSSTPDYTRAGGRRV